MAGRLLEVVPADVGAPAWTDGVSIFIDPDAPSHEQLCSIAVQASLLGAGSLSTDIASELARRRTLACRYLAVEGHRALAEQEHLLPRAVTSLIDHRVAARSASPAASLAIAATREPIDDPPAAFGMIRPRQMRAGVDRAADQRVLSPAAKVSDRDEILRELEEEEEGAVADILSSPIGGGGALGRLLKHLFGDARSAGGGPPGTDSPSYWSRRGAFAAQTTAIMRSPSSIPDSADSVDQQGFLYPEWDVRRRGYRPDWCTVIEVVPKAADSAPLAPPDTHSLRRPLAHLGIDLERRHRQLQGDDIDVDAAVEAWVETIAGSAPDEALYIDSLRGRRDLAVLLLLDISGSAGEPSSSSSTVHEQQRAAAAALLAALHDVGDRVALYGFRSQGRSAVHLIPVKRFGDHLDTGSMHRLGGFVPAGYTRLGAAIRHGAAVLERDGGTARRLLVVLSDGFAYDHGYEGPYGEADARQALAEARRRGMGCVCLSVGANTDADALRRVFGTAAHARIQRAEQLPKVVGPMFRTALRSAEMKRRAAQRKVRTRERLQIERRAG